MLDRTGYLNALRDENSEEANERLENLMELVSASQEYESREPDPSLGGFVDRLSLLSEADEESGNKNARVWMMTMHAAKGLEFPMVVIAGLEEGLFPHSRSAEDLEELEEERRLCYVGMTRARRQLVLTGAARRRVFGEYQNCGASASWTRCPAHLMDRIAPKPSSRYDGNFAPPATTSSAPIPMAAKAPPISETATYAYEHEDQSATDGQSRGWGAPRAVRGRLGDRRRTAQRRHEDHGALHLGRRQEAAGGLHPGSSRPKSRGSPAAYRGSPIDSFSGIYI